MDRCPRCSEPLEAGIGACPACGWVDVGAAEAPGSAAPAQPEPRVGAVARPPALASPSAPPPAELQMRMEGRLLTFRPVDEAALGRDAEERAADGAQVLRVVAYVLVLVVANAFVYAFVSANELREVELVAVPGPDNSTVGVLREGSYNPLSVLGLAYSVPVMVALPPLAWGLWRRKRWAWTPSLGAAFLAMGAFPIGTGMGPAIAYLLTRPAVREAIGAPQEGLGRPGLYGERAPGR